MTPRRSVFIALGSVVAVVAALAARSSDPADRVLADQSAAAASALPGTSAPEAPAGTAPSTAPPPLSARATTSTAVPVPGSASPVSTPSKAPASTVGTPSTSTGDASGSSTTAQPPSTTSTTPPALVSSTTTTPTAPTPIPCPLRQIPYVGARWPPRNPYEPPAGASANVQLVRVEPGVYQLSGVVRHDSVPPDYPPTMIVLDRFAITANYSGEKRTFEVAVSGYRMAPGEEAAFDVPESRFEAPTNFAVAAFEYHCST
jgi:hypothetical protein